jgi:hypothetical protein
LAPEISVLIEEFKRVQESHSSRIQESQLKESLRYKKIEEKSVEAKTLGIGHGNRETGQKTSS